MTYKTVYRITISGRHEKKNFLCVKGSKPVAQTGVCNFLCILDFIGFVIKVNVLRVHKKSSVFNQFFLSNLMYIKAKNKSNVILIGKVI